MSSVVVVGAGNLPSSMPTAASTAYSRNVCALHTYLVKDGALALDPTDDIQAGVLVCHGGAVVHPATAQLLAEESA